MSQSALSCPKCQDEMIQGYVLDYTYGAVLVSQWAEGQPQNSWRGTLKVPMKESTSFLPSMKYRTIPVATFRCQSCGFLESYAREEFAAK
ncbi:PF20097 family protein [Schlesneria paludicola]|uniref:PF20097 family protein n=1 Tax=Schlesneria paludicola TaxID=360056 RepID=UPI00029A667A|nr:PF20097 family protein [Schlesneria paludicola]